MTAIPTPEEPAPIQRRSRNLHSRRAEAPATKKYNREGTVSVKLGTELKDRVDNALAFGGPHVGITTLADFIREAVSQYVTTLEAEVNDGKPFPDVPRRDKD